MPFSISTFHLRREHDSDRGSEPPGLFSAQVIGQATEMHTLRMQLLAELQRQGSSTEAAMAAVEVAARKIFAAAKRIAGADQKRNITAAQHQQIVREVKEAGQVTSLDSPYFDAIGRILVSGPQDSLAASGRARWGDGKVSDAALETMLEANCAIMASVNYCMTLYVSSAGAAVVLLERSAGARTRVCAVLCAVLRLYFPYMCDNMLRFIGALALPHARFSHADNDTRR